MKTTKTYSYTVIGRGTFPVAMLHQDQAWPDDEASAARVGAGRLFAGEFDCEIHLRSNLPPTMAQWASFGWTVLGMTIPGKSCNPNSGITQPYPKGRW